MANTPLLPRIHLPRNHPETMLQTIDTTMTRHRRRKVAINPQIRLPLTMIRPWWISPHTCNGPSHCSRIDRMCRQDLRIIVCGIHGHRCIEAHLRCVITIVYRRMHRVQCHHRFTMVKRPLVVHRPHRDAWHWTNRICQCIIGQKFQPIWLHRDPRRRSTRLAVVRRRPQCQPQPSAYSMSWANTIHR